MVEIFFIMDDLKIQFISIMLVSIIISHCDILSSDISGDFQLYSAHFVYFIRTLWVLCKFYFGSQSP